MKLVGAMKAVVGLVALLVALVSVSLPAQAQSYVEGEDYKRIEPAVRTDNPDKVEVVEIFGYWCQHCASMETYIQPWKKSLGEQAYFKPVPVIFRSNQEELAKAYYVAEALGVTDETHVALFNLIHKQNQTINDKEGMQAFFANYGVDAEQFEKAYTSFSVNSQLSLAKKRARDYGIRVTPTLVVNGKYLITSETAGGQAEMLDVVDYLIEKEGR